MIGRSTMEIAIVEVRARNEELAKMRERHESLRRRLSQRMHALRAGDLVAATSERPPSMPSDAPAWSDDLDEDDVVGFGEETPDADDQAAAGGSGPVEP